MNLDHLRVTREKLYVEYNRNIRELLFTYAESTWRHIKRVEREIKKAERKSK